MMKARTSLWASLAIAASLGLAGCGGSNDNDETNPPAEPSTLAKTAMSEEIELSDAQAAALLAVLPDTGNSVELKGGGERAGVTFACTSADPCTITIENSAGTIVATAHSTTSGEVTGTAAGLEPPAIPAVSGSAGTALRTELIGANGNMPGAAPDGDDGNATEGDADDLSAFLKITGFPTASAELKNPGNKDTKFTKSDTAPAALEGWTGETWTTDGQIIVRYTNQNVETVDDGTFRSRFGEADGGNTDELRSDHATGGAAWDWDLVEHSLQVNAASVTTLRNGGTFDGKYAGVDGTFTVRCNGATGSVANTCGVTLDDDGDPTLVTAAGADNPADNPVFLTFKAENEDAAVESYDKADSDYLAFGWWRKSIGTSHAGIEDFKAIYSGKDTYGAIGGSLAGKATYNGHAAGNYVKGVKNDADAIVPEGGEFVADVELVADFDSANEARSAVKATINEFRDASGDSLGSWELELATVNTATEGHTTSTNSITSLGGDLEGGRDGLAGTKDWESGSGSAAFYGDPGGSNNKQPSGVAGWFRATTNDLDGDTTDNPATAWGDGDVAVAGAFAATQ